MRRSPLAILLLGALALMITAGPAAASPAGAPAAPTLLAGYWDSFIEHWTDVLGKQNGIVMLILVVGAVCLFIITRGKWQK